LALVQLFQDNGGSHSQPAFLGSVAEAQGWGAQETREIYQILIDQGYVEHYAAGGYIVRLTHKGIVEAERLKEDESVRKKRADRVRILERVYELTRKQGPIQIDLMPLMQEMGIESQELDNVYEYLIAEDWIHSFGGGYYIVMDARNQMKAEELLSPSTEIEVFFCYSHVDEELRDQLEKHLSLIQREGLIKSWHDRKIGAGQEWDDQISVNLDRARLILLLVSADFIASEYCWGIEMTRAMAKHEAGTAHVIPIILRPCDWQNAPFGKLQALPKDGVPVVSAKWHSQDEAFLDISKGIRKTVNDLHSAAANPHYARRRNRNCAKR